MADPPSPPSGPTPSLPARKPAGQGRDIPWRLVGLGAVALYAILFAALNSDEVQVHFVFFSTSTSLIVVMLIGILVGAAGGYFFREIRAHRQRKRTTPSP
jgi:uncharacterized integral membrane protein